MSGGARRDLAVARIAAAQHSVIARWQLEWAELGSAAVDARLAKGMLMRLYRGVYRVGGAHPLALPTAALLAAGPGAILGFHTAVWLWGVGPEPRGVVDVIHPGRRASRKGLRFHSGTTHEPDFLTALPVTSPARTITDMATVLTPRDTIRLVDQAFIAGRLTQDDLRDAILPNRRGADTLRAYAGSPRSKSTPEQELFRLLKRGGLPMPEVNALVAGCEFDFVWREQRLIVEYDSLAFHRTRERIENDARKQSAAHAAGFRVERVVRHDLYNEPEALLVRLAQALAQTWPSTAPGTPVLVE